MYWALTIAILVHAILASATGLTGDEAHYLLYAKFLDWSYFDHPPLVGWLQAPVLALTDSVALIRLVPQLIWLCCAWLIYCITRELSREESAPRVSVVLFCLSPILHIHGIALLPDTLLCLFSLLAVLSALHISKRSNMKGGAECVRIDRLPPSSWHWALLGLILGFAGLSKYSAVFLALGLFIYILAAHKRPLPITGILIMLAVGLCTASPVFVWNAANDWISFKYQGGHVAGGAWRPEMVLVFFLTQVLVFGPITTWGLIQLWRNQGTGLVSLRSAWLLSTFFLPLLVLAYLAGGGRSLPYWTSPAWVIALPFAAIGLCNGPQRVGSFRSKATHGGKVTLIFLQLLLVAWAGLSLIIGRPATLSLAHDIASEERAAIESTNITQTLRKPPNPFADVHGWDQLGQSIKVLAEETNTSTLAIGNWTLASRLGWYAWPLPVWVVDSRFDQFDLWTQRPKAGEPVLFVHWSEMPSAGPSKDLSNCQLIQRVSVLHLGNNISLFEISRCLVNDPP